MKRTPQLRHLLGIFTMIALTATAQSALATTAIDKYRFSGDSVSAGGNNWDDCSSYYFSITASTNTTKNNEPPAQSATLYIDIYNWCTGRSSWAWSEANPAWIQLLVQNTRTATLKGNIPMQWGIYDFTTGSNTYYSGNAAVDLQWTGTGSPQRSTETSREHSFNITRSYRSSGVSAKATLSGSISLDGNPFPISGDDVTGSISNSVTGQMNIYRWRGDASPQASTKKLTPQKGSGPKLYFPPLKTVTNK